MIILCQPHYYQKRTGAVDSMRVIMVCTQCEVSQNSLVVSESTYSFPLSFLNRPDRVHGIAIGTVSYPTSETLTETVFREGLIFDPPLLSTPNW